MSTFPPDIITNILCRLPVKPLLRFRCVSKPWCSQIDSPDFIKLHLNHSLKTNSNLTLILRDEYLLSVDLNTLDKAVKLNHPIEDRVGIEGTEVIGSCNGLLALFNSYEDIALWNPSTKKYHKLPITKIEYPQLLYICPIQFVIYGFGYDPITDDYKLVRLVQFYDGQDEDSFHSEVKVYSLKANSWRRIPDFPYYLSNKRHHGVLVSNDLHWVGSRKPLSDINRRIVGFDLCTEQYFEMPEQSFDMPVPDYGDKDSFYYIDVGVFGGCLCVVCSYVHNIQLKIWGYDIWVMKEYGANESWIKLFSIFQNEVPGGFRFVMPLVYSKSADKVLLDHGEKFVWYDLRRKRGEKVKIQDIPKKFEADMCMASLVPLGGQNGTNATKQQATMKKKDKKSGKKRDDFLSQGFKLVL